MPWPPRPDPRLDFTRRYTLDEFRQRPPLDLYGGGVHNSHRSHVLTAATRARELGWRAAALS